MVLIDADFWGLSTKKGSTVVCVVGGGLCEDFASDELAF